MNTMSYSMLRNDQHLRIQAFSGATSTQQAHRGLFNRLILMHTFYLSFTLMPLTSFELIDTESTPLKNRWLLCIASLED